MIIVYFCIYLALWLILSGGRLDLLAFTISIVLALLTPLMLTRKKQKYNLKAVISLFLFFLYNSIRGGFAVARLAVQKNLHLQTQLYMLELKTTTPFVITMLANIYSLMPGTLSMGVEKGFICLHVLDISLLDESFIEDVQSRVLEAFEPKRGAA